ncbi:MAG TPA: YCF48-related protein [Planctomycetaceae bacterium]|nr:YCF48-related protein [Planctomycetaceae bacterium]HRA87714.1 YCF48-related protein [Planctomycetaceae bacterium]
MTRRLLNITLIVTVFTLCCHPATAFQKRGLLNFGDKFDLSEPDVEDSAKENSPSKGRIPSKSKHRSVTKSGPERTPETGSETAPITMDEGSAVAPVQQPKAREPIAAVESNRVTELRTFELLESDSLAEPFFSAAIPRTAAIASDASLNDVCSVGSLVRAVGERGVICFSDDGGATWTTRITPFECSLKSVCFLTNAIGWVAGLRNQPGTSRQSAVLLQTRDGGRTWTDLTSNTGRTVSGISSLYAADLPGILHIQFFGLETAVAVTAPLRNRSGHSIFRTDNGGRTWSAIPADQSAGPWLAAQFMSESDGIVVGQHQSYAALVADRAVIINRPEPTLRAIRDVSLSADGRGWIAGDGGLMLTTADAGVTWKPPESQLPRTVTDIVDFHVVAHQDSTVLLGGNPGAGLLRSSNSGRNWGLVTLPLTGRLNRLYFLNPTEVIGIGSLGQIIRSSDAGETWRAVRSAGFRTGVLNLVTDADKAAWHLLASVAGEQGIRSVVIQMSQPLSLDGAALLDGVPMSDSCTQAVTQLGGNDTATQWMFPRTKPEHHRSSEQLISEWNRQTDGRLRTLLPLRIARDIRNWRPSVIVIEPASDDDAIAAILKEVIQSAVSIAAENQGSGVQLSQLGLSPWKVDRVVSRVPGDQSATLTFRDDDLLPTLGTTTGLLHDATQSLFERTAVTQPAVKTRSGYELLSDANNTDSVAGILDGIDDVLKSDARRPYEFRSRDQIEILRRTLQTAHLEATALNGQMQSGQTEDAIIAQLYGIGANLPATLALKLLRDLADLNLQQNNMEGFLAVQQEIVRRYPTSAEAINAAEMLFLFYSSAEARHYRLGSTQTKTSPSQATSASAPSATHETDGQSSASPYSVQPRVQAPTSRPFASGATNALEALHQKWDSHALTAYTILMNANRANASVPLSPLVQLRIAANNRLLQNSGEQSTILSDLGQRDDRYALFARCELQLSHPTAAPVLPLFNLPKRGERPFLDGQLTDSIWEDAEEIPLTQFVRDSIDPATGGRRRSLTAATDISSLTMLAWDDEFLYLAARLQRAPEKAAPIELALHRSYDAPHGNRDRLELEIDTDHDYSTSFQLTIDETGQTSDRCWMLDKWNPKWFVAVDADAATWRIEAAIPLAELSASGARLGDLWSIRLRRIIPGVLQHEVQTGTNTVSTDGTAMVRFIRPRRKSASSDR